MPSDKNNTPLFKITRRHRQALAMTTAAVLVVGLGAFGMLPQVRGLQPVAADAPVQLAQNTPRATPRVIPPGAPLSFADLVERVSPAVVTIRSEGVTRESETQEVPPALRDFFERFGQGQQQRPQQPRRSVSAGSGASARASSSARNSRAARSAPARASSSKATALSSPTTM